MRKDWFLGLLGQEVLLKMEHLAKTLAEVTENENLRREAEVLSSRKIRLSPTNHSHSLQIDACQNFSQPRIAFRASSCRPSPQQQQQQIQRM